MKTILNLLWFVFIYCLFYALAFCLSFLFISILMRLVNKLTFGWLGGNN